MIFLCVKCKINKYKNTQIHKATSFFYIYIDIYIYKLTERPVVLLNAIFKCALLTYMVLVSFSLV